MMEAVMAGNKYLKRTIVISSVATFLFISTGCSKKTDDQTAEQTAIPKQGPVVELGV